MKKAARLVFAAVLAVVVAACGSRSPAPEPTGSTSSPASSPALSDTPPSILLVTLDTTRADAMGFESGAQTTPALDALAARGVRFAHAYATAPVTLPSHASMLTGLYPYEHGVRENSRYLAADHERLAERLTGAGYRTASVVSGFPLAGQFGLARGFEHYDDDFGIGAVERPADATTDRALERIRSTGSAPLFLWVHYYDPHEPYAPPEPFASEHPGDPYLGEIAFMDSEVGRLVDGFETRFRATGTRILVAGDHGEARGDHGEELHGNLLYQGVMRVPLIVVGDGTGDGNGGAIEPGSRSEPVSVRRVFDTVLEWSGTPRSHDLLEGPSEVVLGEAMKPFLQYGWQPQVMAVLGVTKAIRSGELEIYDLSTDPGESHNLVRDTRLEPKLGRALAAYPVLQKTAEPESSDTEPSRTDRERLAALGYVGWQGAPALQDNAPSPKDMTHLFAALDRGSAQFVRREYAEAITTFEKVLKQDPRNLMVSVRLAVAHSVLGHDKQASEFFERARELAPESPDVDHYLAMHHLRAGRWPQAEPLFERVLTDQPDRLPALEGLASIRERQGRTPEAARLVERMTTLDPEPAAALSRLGALRMALADTPGAIQAFERARAIDSDAFSRFLELGVCYLANRRFPEAREALDRVPTTHPAFSMALFKRAQVSVLLSEPDRLERVRRAYRQADATTRPLIEGEPLFLDLPFR